MLQILLRGSCLVVLALVLAPVAAAQTTVTLTGEQLGGGSTTVTVECGNPSIVTYEITGAAAGPYPGTFVEEGSVTFGADGVVHSFSATFHIDSPAGTVDGEKELDPDALGSFGTCGPSGDIAEFAEVTIFERYTATITDALGRTFTETGRATTSLTAQDSAFGMSQGFQSGGPPGLTIELSPPAAVNATGTTHTVTAIVRDATGQPVEGITVRFVITGSSAQTSRCVTDSDGICSLTYQGPDNPGGADEIEACADTNLNGVGDVGEPCAIATKAWAPGGGTTTSGAHGGGHIGAAETVFGFSAQSTGPGDPVRGACNVFDRVLGLRVKCLDITTLLVTPGHATFSGTAEQDGIATNYTITVDDLNGLGLPDTFSITTGRGYVKSGPVTAGNIVVNP